MPNTTPQTFTVKDGEISITFTHDPLLDGPLENVLPGAVVAKSDSVTVLYGVTLDEIMSKQDGKEVANG